LSVSCLFTSRKQANSSEPNLRIAAIVGMATREKTRTAPLGCGDQQPGDAIRAALGTWRDSLVNLTGGNRLINFKPSKTAVVELIRPSAPVIIDGLRQNRRWDFLGSDDDEAPRRNDVLWTSMPSSTMASVLRRLMRRSKQEYLDRGVSVLYLAAGMLRWKEEDDTAYTSPLLLVPVELTAPGPREVPRLKVSEDDPVVNPGLTLRLKQLGVSLPAVDTLVDIDMMALSKQVRQAVAKPGAGRGRGGEVESNFNLRMWIPLSYDHGCGGTEAGCGAESAVVAADRA
jgi:hypothetical protein